MISVIVPTYNYASFIGETIESIQAQTYENWECIVVDDGSVDNTAKVVADLMEHDSRIRYYFQENYGPSSARNHGIKCARGSFIQFVDADDRICPRKFELQLKILQDRPDIDLVYGSASYYRGDSPERQMVSFTGDNTPWMPEVSGQGDELLRHLLQDNIMVISAPLIRRGAIERCGLFDEGIRYHEDWDYWLKYALAGVRFLYNGDPESCSLIRCHGESLTNDTYEMKYFKLMIRERLADKISSVDLQKLNRRKAEQLGIELGFDTIRKGHRTEGLKQVVKYSLSNGDFIPILYGVKLAIRSK